MYKLEDKKIIFSNEQIFYDLKPISFGSLCDIYKIRIDKEVIALKLFNNLQEQKIGNFERKLDISIDSYIFPVKLLYVNDKFRGYIMKFCKGKNLERRKLDITVDEFASSVSKLVEDTEKLSKIRYNLYDTFLTNVMYDNGFKMIDTDDYIFEETKSISEINTINTRRLNQILIDIFLKNTGLSTLYFSDVQFKKLIKKCENGELLFEEILNTLCMEAYNIANCELEKISEVGKVLIKNKKI